MSGPRGKITRFDGGTRPWNVPTPYDTAEHNVKYAETAQAKRERELCLNCDLPDCAPYSNGCKVCDREGRSKIRGKRTKLEPPEEFLDWAWGPMTNPEWAAMLGVSKTTISRWRKI